jgi:hypothetical protein
MVYDRHRPRRQEAAARAFGWICAEGFLASGHPLPAAQSARASSLRSRGVNAASSNEGLDVGWFKPDESSDLDKTKSPRRG